MSVDAQVFADGQVFLLQDYATLTRYWRVHTLQGAVLRVQETEKGLDETVHGMLERCQLAGRETTLGFLSMECLDGAARVPDYSKNLLILLNERLLGDGLMRPQLQFQRGFFAREITVQAEDGWAFHAHYTAPWLREIVRKLNLGGTLEYDPVDFIERLVEIVGFHRKHWLAAVAVDRKNPWSPPAW